jgi:hypothetical protein
MLNVVGGNEEDAVTMDRVRAANDGTLLSVDHPTEWPIVIEVHYDAEREPVRQ